MKKCSKCGQTKAIAEFHKQKSQKDHLRPHCKECSKKIARIWYIANSEKVKAASSVWQKANPERVNKKNKKWNLANPLKRKTILKRWDQKNPHHAREYFHKKGISKTYNTGRSLVKGYKKPYAQKYKALKKGGGELAIKTIKLIYQNNIKRFATLTCYLCLTPISFENSHLEHKIPLSRGGTNVYENLEVSCQHCNHAKGNKTTEEYINWVVSSGTQAEIKLARLYDIPVITDINELKMKEGI